MVYLVPPMVLPPLLTGQVAGWLPEPVWTLSKSEIPYILESNQHYKFDVWLAVHRSSMWNKKPTRCHLVLYLFLLYKLIFISCSTCLGPPCAHPQELMT